MEKVNFEIEQMKRNEDRIIKLQEAYYKRNNKEIETNKVERDIEKIAKKMIECAEEFSNGSQIAHEILECGKERQYGAIISLLGEREKKIADKYLPSWYAEDVNDWALTFYNTAKLKLQEMLDGGIESYRDFEEDCLYGDTNKIASAFNMEEEFVNLLVKEGNKSDLNRFMRTMYISKDGEWKEKSCPKRLVSKIFDMVKDAQEKDKKIRFNRNEIMRGFTAIYKCEDLTDKEKEEIESEYIKAYLDGQIDNTFNKLIIFNVADKLETMKQYIQLYKERDFEKLNEFIEEKTLPEYERKACKLYDQFIEKLEKEDNLTPEKLMEIKENLNITEDLYISYCEETNKSSCLFEFRNAITGLRDFIELDNNEFEKYIEIANNNSRKEAELKLNDATKKGIGNIQITDGDNEYIDRIKERKDDIIGAVGKNNDSLYLKGGKINGKRELGDVKAVAPYYIVGKNGNYICIEEMEMSEEQVKDFNQVEMPDVKEHTYIYGRVDGYYSRKVSDFQINGETYHIKNDDWTNDGTYTVLWKGQDSNYPEEAMGITSSYSEWARCQRGVDNEYVIKLIAQNPRRFAKLIEENQETRDSCGCFSLSHLESIFKYLAKMPTEEQLEKEETVEEIAKLANEKERLEDKEVKTEELLKQFEMLEKQKGKRVGE